jgi:hypothetical protein
MRDVDGPHFYELAQSDFIANVSVPQSYLRAKLISVLQI